MLDQQVPFGEVKHVTQSLNVIDLLATDGIAGKSIIYGWHGTC